MHRIQTPTIRPGISVLLDHQQDLLKGKRIGVLTNASGVLPDVRSSLDALMDMADVQTIFSPEHGLFGAAREGVHVGDSKYRNVPVYSLYGDHLVPTAAQLDGLDLIVCDIQDIGCRFYTYSWTVVQLVEAAAQCQISVIIADRPNPLGAAIEGPGVEPAYRTLVGFHDVPIRHGLTLGELVLLVNYEAGFGCDLAVVPCSGWQRRGADDQAWTMWELPWGLPWVPPSPNVPTPDTVLVYPGTCLLEGTNVSVGRGTTKPFEWLGAPWIDGAALANALNVIELPGVRWRPVAFVPCQPPYPNMLCHGVQPHVVDAGNFRPIRAGVALVAMLVHLYVEQLTFDTGHFDRLAGDARLRQLIGAGAPLDEIMAPWAVYQQQFVQRSAPFRLYA